MTKFLNVLTDGFCLCSFRRLKGYSLLFTSCTMGKRYYCDYCDRSFQDNMHNRKKHLNGVQHHRAKKAWFDHFRGEIYSNF